MSANTAERWKLSTNTATVYPPNSNFSEVNTMGKTVAIAVFAGAAGGALTAFLMARFNVGLSRSTG